MSEITDEMPGFWLDPQEWSFRMNVEIAHTFARVWKARRPEQKGDEGR